MIRTASGIHSKNEFAEKARFGSRKRRGWLLRAVDILLTWQERAHARRQLAELPAYLLKDVGITRTAAVREANKPFWKE